MQYQYKPLGCLGCGRCSVCPPGIDLEKVLLLVDRFHAGDEQAAAEYKALPIHAGACVGCGRCLRHCPHGVNIMDGMSRARKTFGF